MTEKLFEVEQKILNKYGNPSDNDKSLSHDFILQLKADMFDALSAEINRQYNKKNYAHYFDIRTNHLNEKDWRRSFSINQMLYGMILAATADHTLHNSFDEILPILKEEFKNE